MGVADTHAVLADVFAQNSSKRLLIGADGRELAYAQFQDTARNIAWQLLQRGLKPGNRLMIQIDNSEYLLALYLACAMAGVVACPVDPLLPEGRAAALKLRVAPAMLVDARVLNELLAAPAPAGIEFPAVSDDADFLVVFSSGSTGEAKGIVH